MQSLSDEHIMEQVSQGQVDKLALLFERYNVRLYNFFLQNTRNQSLSEDLTQNVFMRILKYKNSYKKGASFKAWFFRIARNVQTDHFRKKKLETSQIEEDSIDRNLKLSEENFDLEKKEEVGLLYEALDKLAADKKEILVLSQLQELEYTEIAAILNITENAARVKVHRALKALKDVFQKQKK